MACMYCERLKECGKFNQPVLFKSVPIIGNQIDFSVGIYERKLCLCVGDKDDVIAKKINYCPMCGRKLEDE